MASGKVSIGDFLQSLPVHANAPNTNINSGGDGATRVSLRGLGAERTLVLLNGRRYVHDASGADAAVDLNSVPAAAIDRVEILKAGASALYGADAVGGVVNLVTRRSWKGTEAAVVAGTSSRGDGAAYDVAVTTGARSAKSGFIASAGFHKSEPVWAKKRDWSKDASEFGYDQTLGVYSLASRTTPQSRIILTNSQRGQPVSGATDLYNSLMTACTEAVRSNCPPSYVYDPGAPLQWRPYDPITDVYNFAAENFLVTPQQRLQLFASADYQLSDTTLFYAEGAFVNRQSKQKRAPAGLPVINATPMVAADGLYNPFGVDIFVVQRRLVEFGHRTTGQDVDSYRLVGGLHGMVDAYLGPLTGLSWDASLNYGVSTSNETSRGYPALDRLTMALGPSYMSDTEAFCGTPSAPIFSCVPLNVLGGPGSIDRRMIDYLTVVETRRSRNTLFSAQADVSATLFRLGSARPMGVALGYEFRDVSGSSKNDPSPAATILPEPEVPQSGYSVNEIYAEVSLPLLGGLPLLDDVDLSAAARVFDYSTSGSDFTYSLSGRWQVISDFAFRGGYTTAVHAPGMSDLYKRETVGDLSPVRDPCSNFQHPPASCGPASFNGDDRNDLPTTTRGNAKLQPEAASTFTLGAVFTPRLADGLLVTLDYYEIHVDDVISYLGADVILASCYPRDGSGLTPKYCDLVARDPDTQRIERVVSTPANDGGERTAGIDFGVRYHLPTSFGHWGLRLDATWLRYHDRTLPGGTVVAGKGNYDLAQGGVGGVYPEWRFNAGILYNIAGLTAGVGARHIGTLKECGEEYGLGTTWSADYSGRGKCYLSELRRRTDDSPSVLSRDVGSYTLFDVQASYELDLGLGKTTFGVSVSNVLDVEPRRIYNGYTNASDPMAYDFMGRYFYARVTHAL